jgi:hypothetical protein
MVERRAHRCASAVHLKPILDAAKAECFTAHCECRWLLHLFGALDFHACVDGMQRHAEDRGLVAALGQDRVQAMMAAAFETARQPLFSEDCGPVFERAA